MCNILCACVDKCVVGHTRIQLGEPNEYYLNNLQDQYKIIENYFTFEDNLVAGRVEHCFDGKDYVTVCGDSWTNREASVVCRQLGFQPFG